MHEKDRGRRRKRRRINGEIFRSLPGADIAQHDEVYYPRVESDDPFVMSIEVKKASPKVAVAVTTKGEVFIGTETWANDPGIPMVDFINQSPNTIPLEVMSTVVGRFDPMVLEPQGTINPDNTAGDQKAFMLLEEKDRVTVKLGLPKPVTVILKLGQGLGPFRTP